MRLVKTRSTIAHEPTIPRPYKAQCVITFQNAAIQWYFWLGPQFQVETLAKSVKHANTVYMTITKKKGGMLDPGRCRVLFDHRGQIIAKPPQSAGYSTDIAEEDAIEIGMLTKKTHFAFAGPITNAKNAVSSSYAPPPWFSGFSNLPLHHGVIFRQKCLRACSLV